ncbi:hypothetical protein AMS68_003222 [Peltaster fructicola]|uniref:F-box domain-containing protein n=1 Tax=Peltaster fructicola TaxID=286661 RepID=A0A6H0XST0_9PEZI|nr:hypothetical protein AMS68_003222 [Peltaster fructicola]
METLIEDVVLLVFSYLNQADLFAVCLTCTRLRNIAETVLYSKISWRWDRSTSPPVIRFLNAILRRPALAKHVRTLTLTQKRTVTGTAGKIELPPASTEELDADLAAQVLSKTGVPFASKWLAEIGKRSMDSLLALVVSQTTNLTRLQLDEAWSMQSALLCKVVAAGIDGAYSLPTYSSLLSVGYGSWHSETPYRCIGTHTTALLSFFYLPSIRTLLLMLDTPIKLSWLAQTPSCTSLVSLHLSNVGEQHLAGILTATPKLAQLHYTWQYVAGYQHCKSLLDLRDLMGALAMVKTTLEDLAIVLLNHDDYYMRTMIDRVGSVQDLTSFGALKRLRVPLIWIDDFGEYDEDYNFSRTIPKDLQELSLGDDLHLHEEWTIDEAKVIQGLEDMLKSRQLLHPKLSSIHIEIEGDQGWLKENRERMQELGRVYGVSLMVRDSVREIASVTD